MPRPITKADIKRWRDNGWYSFRVYIDDRLGFYIQRIDYPSFAPLRWSYSVKGCGCMRWVTKKTLERRKKLGQPDSYIKKRKSRQRMPEGAFSLEEMELASSIMEELSDG